MEHERTDGHGDNNDDGSTSVLTDDAAVNLPPELAAGRLLIVGGGYCGSRLARRVRAGGGQVRVTRRQPDGADGLVLDDATGVRPDPARLAGTTHLLVTAAPAADGQDPVLRLLATELTGWPLRWVGVLSSTGVYGDSGGAWVDEDTPLPATSGRSASRIRCEDAWRSLGVPLQILRLPGIYGPGRNPLAGLGRGEARLVHKPGQVFSRVHVDDIVGAILHNLELPASHRPTLLNVADRRPAPSSEVLGFAAHLLGMPLPPFRWYAEAEASMGPMARSFWQDNRRVSSRRLTDGLGYRLKYPTYREGLRGCLREEGGRPDPGRADRRPADR